MSKTIEFQSGEERNYTFEEIANELGIDEEELIAFSKREGLLDQNGLPTPFAIENDLLTIKIENYE